MAEHIARMRPPLMPQTPERRRVWRKEYRALNHATILEADRARKRSYGRPCLDCGKTTDGSNGRAKAPLRCHRCNAIANTVWTREACIEAIRTFAHRYGKPPGARDWNATMARNQGRADLAERFYSDGDYPESNTIQLVFGSWNAGIEAAGFAPRKIGGRGPQTSPRRTHCKRGHEFTPDNTYEWRPGLRQCKTCNRERKRAHYQRSKAAA